MRTISCVLAAAVLAVPATRADQLDVQLNEQMGSIVRALHEKGYRNVGVLRFRFQDGKNKESFAPPVCGDLADRVENLLVIHAGPMGRPVLNVLHRFGPTAARQKVGRWYSNASEREKLFAVSCPVAWGKQRARPDALITGKLTIRPGGRTTTLSLELFDRIRLRPTLLGKPITVSTDIDILRDVGYSFALSRQVRQKLRASPRSAPPAVHQFTFARLDCPPGGPIDTDPPPTDTRAEPGNIGGVAIEVLADDTAQEIEKSPEGTTPDYQVRSPAAAREVAIRLKNTTDRRLAVVLRVNGYNTLDEQTETPDQAYKWVLPPRTSYRIKGFYLTRPAEGLDEPGTTTEGKYRIRPFRVLEGEEAQAARELLVSNAELAAQVGLIEVDVFEEREGEVVDATPRKPSARARRLPRSRETEARSSYLGVRSALLKSARLKTEVVKARVPGPRATSRELIVPDRDAERELLEGLERTDFKNPGFVARIAVRVLPARGDSPDS